jgi:hypothetical protein
MVVDCMVSVMNDGINSRIETFLRRKSEQDAEKARREAATKSEVVALAKIEAEAPAVWAERWKMFEECAREINEKLAPAKIRVGVSPLPKLAVPGELSHFRISGEAEGQRWEYYIDCTVKSRGDIAMSRSLPQLTDAPYARGDTIDRNWIANLLMEFVENCQGFHSSAEMLTQHR